MSITQLRAELKELRGSIISQYEPRYKVFILGVSDSPTEAEIEAYNRSHPYTKVITLVRKSCRKESLQ